MHVSERRENERVAGRDRRDFSVPQKLGAAALVISAVDWNHNTDVCALIVMPSALLLVGQVVVRDLDAGNIIAISPKQTPEHRVQNVLHNKPHSSVQFRYVLGQHDFWNLAKLVLVFVCFKPNLDFHILDFAEKHFAELSAE